MKNTKYVQIEHTGNFKQFLIGSYLGDGSFTKLGNGAKNSRLSIAHGINQKEYAIKKWTLLDNLDLAGKLSENEIADERCKLGYFEEIRFKSLSHPIFTQYRVKGYVDGKKRLNLDLIEDIDILGLAIWFMDDGSRTNDSCELNCHKFYDIEKLQLSTLLNRRFNIAFNVTQNTLYIPKEQHQKFKLLVLPYVLDSLKYKLEPYKGSV